MRVILVAPTAYKGTIGPVAAAESLAGGARRALPDAETRILPLSDGGTGLLEAYARVVGGRTERLRVTGPTGEPVEAAVVRHEQVAVIESAEACGLHRIPVERRDPTLTTTRGVGELLRHAERGGAGRVVLGLGGSGTVDGGTGMARALGWSFRDAEGQELPEGGGALCRLARIVPPRTAFRPPVTALCDVTNRLLGPDGAARVYGPQKGATEAQVRELEAGLARLAEIAERDLGVRVADLAGGGAAGGLGAGARLFLSARLELGADWVLRRFGAAEALHGAELLITGEGRFDEGSLMGKVTGRLLEMSAEADVPVLLICGRVDVPVPPGVRAAGGGGGRLTREDLRDLAESGCRALAGEGTL